MNGTYLYALKKWELLFDILFQSWVPTKNIHVADFRRPKSLKTRKIELKKLRKKLFFCTSIFFKKSESEQQNEKES